jgi:hypothetical protein
MTFENVGESDVYKEISEIAINWYRDENGIDMYHNEGVSLGQLISCSAVIFFASIYREYFYFKDNYNVDEPIAYNEQEHPIRLLVARRLSNNFRIDNSVPASGEILDRKHGKIPAYRKASNFISCMQYPIIPFLKNRKLYLSDWTYSMLENNNDKKDIFINSKNILKGAYLRYSENYIKSAEKYFPNSLDVNKIKNSLISRSKMVSIFLPDDLISLFCDYIMLYYKQNRAYFISVFAIYEELIVRYKPHSVVFPGELYEPYVLIRSICKLRKVKTILMIDGFPLFVYYPHFKDEYNNNYCFDQFVSFGMGMHNDFLTKKIAQEQIIKTKWPVFDRYDYIESNLGVYDCIIMTWIPLNTNPIASIDRQNKIFENVLALVKTKGYSKIAVKIKGAIEKKYVLPLLKNEQNIDILEGPLYKHLKKAKMIIGGLSSAIAEARYCDIPYYIYEPYQNGYPDSLLFNSSVISRDLVARNIDELDNNIKTNMSIMNIDKTFIIHNTSKKNEKNN